MRWLIWPRQYGKTHRVIEWWLEDPAKRIIVTHSESTARNHRHRAEKEAWDKPRYAQAWNYAYSPWGREFQKVLKDNIMSWRSWENSRQGRGRPACEVAIDDCVKAVLRKFVGPIHNLAIISDAGRVEEPDVRIASEAEHFNTRIAVKYYEPDFDRSEEGY